MDFMNAIKNELDDKLTYTENGALAYETSGKALMDFVFATSALRRENEEEIMRTLTKVYFECPLLATKVLFWTRDCREGNGERRIFREFLKWLAWNEPEVGKAVIGLVPYYGRWDDLWMLFDTDLKDDVISFVKEMLAEDLKSAENGDGVSLLAKWMPSLNTSSPQTRHYAEILRKGFGLTPRQYRKTLSQLRKRIGIIERQISANEWGAVEYSKVPSQANVKYNSAFLRHDEERRRQYLEDLRNGKTKINASVLQPHEIVAKYITGMGWNMNVGKYDEALEQLWKALPVKSLDNVLVIRDGSGSMATLGYGTTVRPLDVATALAVYMADHNHGIWKDKFITFSANPKLIDLANCSTLHDKLVKTYHEDDWSNTDIEKTMMLVLQTAIKNNCSQEDMPKSIICVSDMGFDSAVYDYNGGRTRKALFDNIAKAYEKAGYKLPRMVFWNVAGRTGNGIPMKQNDLGVILLGGFSIQLLDMVMSGELDPYKAILKTIGSQRYDLVEEAIADII